MTVRLRAARHFIHRDHPTTVDQIGRFREHARSFIQEFGEDSEVSSFDEAWHDAFLVPPISGRVEKLAYDENEVGIFHPGLARRALRTVLDVMRRVDPSTTEEPAATSDDENPRNEAEIVVRSEPRISSWRELHIRFLSDERIDIIVRDQHQTLNYAEFGFEDRRSGKPTAAWGMLRELALNHGTISAPPPFQTWKKVEKRMQEIKKVFKTHFGPADNPIPFISHGGYQAQFHITLGPSFET